MRNRGVSAYVTRSAAASAGIASRAAKTALPVLGVPVESHALHGVDSLLSIAQMPAGVPVATVAIGGARNAGLLAARILAISDDELHDRVCAEHLHRCAERVLQPTGRRDHREGSPGGDRPIVL